MTGVASRHVGYWVSAFLVVMGLFPIVGAFFLMIPKPVLGGATLVLFGTIAVAGIRILASEPIDQRRTYIMAVSFGLSIGVILVPAASQQLPDLIRQVVATPITLAGLSAIVLSLAIPARTKAAPDKDETPAAGPA